MREKLLEIRDWFLMLAEQAPEKERWRYYKLANAMMVEAERIGE